MLFPFHWQLRVLWKLSQRRENAEVSGGCELA
jgi:hypothetical protein